MVTTMVVGPASSTMVALASKGVIGLGTMQMHDVQFISRESSDRWVATAGRGGPRVTHLESRPRSLRPTW